MAKQPTDQSTHLFNVMTHWADFLGLEHWVLEFMVACQDRMRFEYYEAYGTATDDELQGFSLFSGTARTAKIFIADPEETHHTRGAEHTILHELVHILFEEGGLDQTDINVERTINLLVDAFLGITHYDEVITGYYHMVEEDHGKPRLEVLTARDAGEDARTSGIGGGTGPGPVSVLYAAEQLGTGKAVSSEPEDAANQQAEADAGQDV